MAKLSCSSTDLPFPESGGLWKEPDLDPSSLPIGYLALVHAYPWQGTLGPAVSLSLWVQGYW